MLDLELLIYYWLDYKVAQRDSITLEPSLARQNVTSNTWYIFVTAKSNIEEYGRNARELLHHLGLYGLNFQPPLAGRECAQPS